MPTAASTRRAPGTDGVWTASVYIHASFHRRGVGRGLYTSLFRMLAAQALRQPLCGCDAAKSRQRGDSRIVRVPSGGRLPERGLQGRRGYDVGWWQRALQTPPASPPPTLTFDAIRHDPAWPEMLASGLSCIDAGGGRAR